MKRKIYNLIGQTFGTLAVIAEAPPQQGRRQLRWMWLVRCKCGIEKPVRQDRLLKDIQSCGCLTPERIGDAHRTHGQSLTPEWNLWRNMKERCKQYGKPTKFTAYYRDRGIIVCQRWINSFEDFFADVGKRPSPEYTFDRTNNNGNYSCGKCEQCIENGWNANWRWATRRQQLQNTRRTRWLTARGETLTISDWGKRQGFGHSTIARRLSKGWSVENAIFTPVM